MRNGVKNGNSTKFSSKNQPSPDAKKRGWNRRKEALSLINGIQDYFEMNYKELKAVKEDQLTGREVLHLRFALDLLENSTTRRFWVDKHIPVIKSEDIKDDKPKEKHYRRITVHTVEELERLHKLQQLQKEEEDNLPD